MIAVGGYGQTSGGVIAAGGYGHGSVVEAPPATVRGLATAVVGRLPNLIRGDTNELSVTITRPDANGVSQPVSLAGAALWFTLKLGWDDPDEAALIQKTIGAGIGVVEPPSGGVALITLAPADTATLAGYRRYVYDVQLREADMTITTVSRGSVVLTRDATASTV